MPATTAQTPLMRQYEAIKRQHADAIVLFRMGDFFETFGEDAIVTAKVCGIVLTKRNNGAAGDVPLAGFPHHQLDTYLPKLVAAGYRVAVCEQLEDPKQARGLVKRGIVEIVTPGVALYDKVLEAGTNRYVAALVSIGELVGLAYADVSTGEFVVGQMSWNEALTALETLAVAEVLVPKPQADRFQREHAQRALAAVITRLEPWHFDADDARRVLTEHFGTHSLKGFGVEELDAGIAAAGALFRYISDAQLGNTQHIRSLRRWQDRDVMLLDAGTRRNLDLLPSGDGRFSLIAVLDRTLTPMGARLLKQWLLVPLRRMDAITERLDAVEQLYRHEELRHRVRTLLEPIGDVERLVTKICTARATPREVRSLATVLGQVPLLARLAVHLDSGPLRTLLESLPPMEYLRERVERALVDQPTAQLGSGGVFRPGYSPQLDAALEALYHGKEWLARYQEQLRQQTGIGSLKLGFNNVFGYYIEVTNAHRAKVPDSFIRKQTLTNAERYTPLSLMSSPRALLQLPIKCRHSSNSSLLSFVLKLQSTQPICRNWPASWLDWTSSNHWQQLPSNAATSAPFFAPMALCVSKPGAIRSSRRSCRRASTFSRTQRCLAPRRNASTSSPVRTWLGNPATCGRSGSSS